jgi:iron complex transport system substrate-binding protein
MLFHAKNAKVAKGVWMDVEEIAAIAVDCGLKVHQGLGPGVLESAYEAVMAAMITSRGLCIERQKIIPIRFNDLVIDDGFRADLVVEGKLLIELKSLERLAPVHGKQVLTYLRFMDLPIGLLMNFGAPTFREGLRRIVNQHIDTGSSSLRINRQD